MLIKSAVMRADMLKKYLILFEKVRHYSVFFRQRTHSFLLSV